MNQNESQSLSKSASSMKVNPWVAIIVAAGWPMVGFIIPMITKMAFDIEISKLISSLINLLIGSFGVLYLFPKAYQAPFGQVPLAHYLKRLGVYLPIGAGRHILLGVLLAGCTLSGMLIASLLTGRYVLDWGTLNLSQIVFSLNPGIFEEIFYRGIITVLLLATTKSLKKAALLQIVIFGLAHVKGFDLPTLVDVISVMIIAIAFTYVAYRTRTLLAGMVFHFLHDSLLFFVQVPDRGTYIGFLENFLFYAFLWLMVGVGCGLIWYATEHLNVRAEDELYSLDAA